MPDEWSDEWPTVATFPSEVEADMAQGALGADGIEAIVWKDDAGGMYPSLQPVYGVALRVAPEQLERAREILAALAQGGEEAEGEEGTEDTGAPGEGEPAEEPDAPGGE